MVAMREMARDRHHGFGGDCCTSSARRTGPETLARTAHRGPGISSREGQPDRWLVDGTELDLRSRTLRHVIHRVTPSVNVSSTTPPRRSCSRAITCCRTSPRPSGSSRPGTGWPWADYLASLHRMLALPDAVLLPAHGPVTGSTHDRVNELLAHHDLRLAETRQAVLTGHATAYEVAQAIRWTRSPAAVQRAGPDSKFLATSETAAHLEVLALRGELTRHPSEAGVVIYQVAPPRPATAG